MQFHDMMTKDQARMFPRLTALIAESATGRMEKGDDMPLTMAKQKRMDEFTREELGRMHPSRVLDILLHTALRAEAAADRIDKAMDTIEATVRAQINATRHKP